jgi:hypothetical protein
MYFVLACGYWHQSRKPDLGPGQVDTNLDESNRGVDYIVKIHGLPDDFVKPSSITKMVKYWCKKCNSVVPSWDMEKKNGCFFHDPEPQVIEEVPEYERGIFEPYTCQHPAAKWLNKEKAFRIFLDNQQGIEKWRQIWRYVQQKYPATKSLAAVAPVRVGDRRQWLISIEDVPTIDLTEEGLINLQTEQIELVKRQKADEIINYREEIIKLKEQLAEVKKERAKVNKIVCAYCGFSCSKPTTYRAHLKAKHKDIYAQMSKKEEVNGLSDGTEGAGGAAGT